MRPDFINTFGFNWSSRAHTSPSPLRELSCLLFNRADSVGHYSPEESALHRLIRCYSATTAPAKLVEYIFVRSSILRLSCPDTVYPGALMSPTSQEEGDFGEEKNRSLNIP